MSSFNLTSPRKSQRLKSKTAISLLGILALSLGLAACATKKLPIVKMPMIDFGTAGCKPEYPRAALRYEQQGMVELAVQVDVDGSISGVEVLKSSNFPLLDNAVRDRLLAGSCKGEPGTVDGQAQVSRAKVRYVWKLN